MVKGSTGYQYLTGPRFRDHVQSIVEKFTEMGGDLSRERKTMTRLWAKREEQIRGVIAPSVRLRIVGRYRVPCSERIRVPRWMVCPALDM